MLIRILMSILLILPTPAIATELTEEGRVEESSDIFQKILIAEGLFLVNAWMASEDPELYGGLLAILAPLGATGSSDSPALDWIGFFAAEAIALYNIEIDEDEKSKNDIFQENMIAWHLFAGVLGLSHYILGDSTSPESLKFSPTPNNGVQFQYQYKF